MVSRDPSPSRLLSPNPSRVPLPPSPSTPGSRSNAASPSPDLTHLFPRGSPVRAGRSPNGERARSPLSSKTPRRPVFNRNDTSLTAKQGPADSFHEGSTIFVNQPVGSLSISPSSRDVCLASRKGLYILDLENLDHAPRFIPQGGTWQIAE